MPGELHIPRSQLGLSLRIVWLIVSIPLFLSIVLATFAPAEMTAIAPTCVWKSQLGRECGGCGLTTAFVLIGTGDWQGAAHANAAGAPLFVSFVVNSIVAAAYAMRRLMR
jgi:hypothetical protein